jgi:hypothetical protein
MQETDTLLTAVQFEMMHGYNRGDVLFSEDDDQTVRSLLVHRNVSQLLNTETDNSLDYGKSTVVAHNEGLRRAMTQNVLVRVCAVINNQGRSTYYDRGMFRVAEERMFSFYMKKDAATQAAAPRTGMHGKPWNLADDRLLSVEHASGASMVMLASLLGRNIRAIESRLEHHVKDKTFRKRLMEMCKTDASKMSKTDANKMSKIDASKMSKIDAIKMSKMSKTDAADVVTASTNSQIHTVLYDTAVPKKKRKLNSDAKPATAPASSMVTHYDGNMFRSRHEARFAFLLNQLGVRYEYEGSTFDMKTGVNQRYTPDFFLPELHMWVELKPAYPHWEEMARCAELCMRGFPTVLMYGDGYVVPFGYDTHGGGSTGSGYTHSRGLKGMSWRRDDGTRMPGELAFTYTKNAISLQPCDALDIMQAAGHPVLKSAYDATVNHKFE